MKCPKCKDRTEVLETRPAATYIRRRRRCLNPHCLKRFTTTESRVAGLPVAGEAALRARALAREFSSKVADPEALEAALTVDMRRAEIARQQRAQRRAERDTWYDDDGFDAAPTRLDRDALKRELGEF